MATNSSGQIGSGLPKLAAGTLALVALGASVLSDADPVVTMVRGAAAFVIGHLVGSIIVVLLNQPQKSVQLEVVEGREAQNTDPPEHGQAA